MPFINGENNKVFISYSHDSPEHLERVLSLSDRLRRDGIDCLIDQYEISPRQGWPRWTMSQIEEARFVLVICSETYHRRVRGREETGKGLGAKWEGAVITQELYDSEADNDKFIPVLFSSEDADYIPVYLRGATRYVLDDDYEDLYRHLTNQPKHVRPALGAQRSLPPRDRKEDFLDTPESRVSREPAGGSRMPNPPTTSQSRSLASWIFGSLLLIFFVYAYLFSPDTLPEYKQRMLAFACALIAGLFGFFLTGAIGLQIHSAQTRFGTISIKATAGVALFVLMLIWWFSPLAPVKPKPPNLPSIVAYRVHITVVDPQQLPVYDADIRPSVDGELKKNNNGWELNIPVTNKPGDGRITLYALKPADSLYGEEVLVLDKDPSPAVKIHLYQNLSRNPPNHNLSHVPPPPAISIYSVSVTVLDSEHAPVEDAEIYSRPAGTVKKVGGGYEIDVPAVHRPADGKLKIYASKKSAFLNGETSVPLDKNPNPTVEIYMQRDTSAHVNGKVVDGSSRAIVGAWVNVAGHERDRVQTRSGGEFNLAAYAAEGQLVRLHVEMEGYTPEDQPHLAGRFPAIIKLHKRE